MNPEQQTIEKIDCIIAENCFNAHPTMRETILSVISEIVLAQVRKKEHCPTMGYDSNKGGWYGTDDGGLRPRTAAEIEAALIEHLGGGN